MACSPFSSLRIYPTSVGPHSGFSGGRGFVPFKLSRPSSSIFLVRSCCCCVTCEAPPHNRALPGVNAGRYTQGGGSMVTASCPTLMVHPRLRLQLSTSGLPIGVVPSIPAFRSKEVCTSLEQFRQILVLLVSWVAMRDYEPT